MFIKLLFASAIIGGSLDASVEYSDTLSQAVVTAQHSQVISQIQKVPLRDALPGEGLSQSLERLPGFQINDYGGLNGTKNISLRGLGAAHTVFLIDGVRASNVQTGSIDLTDFDLPGSSDIVIDFLHSSIDVRTAAPTFDSGRRVEGAASMGVGSFGQYAPRLYVGYKLSDCLSARADLSALWSEGDYPYIDPLSHIESTRINNGISKYTGSVDLFGQEWHAKAYFNHSDRDCPGSLSYPAADTQRDWNAFVQGSWAHTYSRVYSSTLSAKASLDRLYYDGGSYTNDYRQYEMSIVSHHRFAVSEYLVLSADMDVAYDRLGSDLYSASRVGLDAQAMASLRLGRFAADLVLGYIGAFDSSVEGGEGRGSSNNALTPSLGLKYEFLPGLSAIASARRAYRIPTFNDLYYTGMGNPDLKPEDAWVTSIGVDWTRSMGAWRLGASADGYYNKLTNKIVSAPTEDPYLWSMFNLGQAETAGIDVSLSALWAQGPWSVGALAKASFQMLDDIPYAPKQSGVLTLDLGWKDLKLSAIYSFRGERLDSYQAAMAPYSTIDLTARYHLHFGLDLFLSGRNLSDSRYEIVTGYPMPARSVLAGVMYKW